MSVLLHIAGSHGRLTSTEEESYGMQDLADLNYSSMQLQHLGAVDATLSFKSCPTSRTKWQKACNSYKSQRSSCPDGEAKPCPAHQEHSPQPHSERLTSNSHLLYSPLIDVVSFKCVNSVNVWYVENWLITGRIRGQFHQDFIKENRLKEKQTLLWRHHPDIKLKLYKDISVHVFFCRVFESWRIQEEQSDHRVKEATKDWKKNYPESTGPWGTSCTHHFVHFELGVGLGAEQFIRARRDKLFDHVGKQQEVVEQEAIQLLAALRLVQLAAVQELPWSQAVCEGIEHGLLGETKIHEQQQANAGIGSSSQQQLLKLLKILFCLLNMELPVKRREAVSRSVMVSALFPAVSKLNLLTNNKCSGLDQHSPHGHFSAVQKLCLRRVLEVCSQVTSYECTAKQWHQDRPAGLCSLSNPGYQWKLVPHFILKTVPKCTPDLVQRQHKQNFRTGSYFCLFNCLNGINYTLVNGDSPLPK